MSPVATATAPEVDRAVHEAMHLIAHRGMTITTPARELLMDIAEQGFRELATSRVLDLPTREREAALERASASLHRFVSHWIEATARSGSRELTSEGFHATRASICPVYPF